MRLSKRFELIKSSAFYTKVALQYESTTQKKVPSPDDVIVFIIHNKYCDNKVARNRNSHV
jgi:hypothetical protein